MALLSQAPSLDRLRDDLIRLSGQRPSTPSSSGSTLPPASVLALLGLSTTELTREPASASGGAPSLWALVSLALLGRLRVWAAVARAPATAPDPAPALAVASAAWDVYGLGRVFERGVRHLGLGASPTLPVSFRVAILTDPAIPTVLSCLWDPVATASPSPLLAAGTLARALLAYLSAVPGAFRIPSCTASPGESAPALVLLSHLLALPRGVCPPLLERWPEPVAAPASAQPAGPSGAPPPAEPGVRASLAAAYTPAFRSANLSDADPAIPYHTFGHLFQLIHLCYAQAPTVPPATTVVLVDGSWPATLARWAVEAMDRWISAPGASPLLPTDPAYRARRFLLHTALGAWSGVLTRYRVSNDTGEAAEAPVPRLIRFYRAVLPGLSRLLLHAAGPDAARPPPPVWPAVAAALLQVLIHLPRSLVSELYGLLGAATPPSAGADLACLARELTLAHYLVRVYDLLEPPRGLSAVAHQAVQLATIRFLVQLMRGLRPVKRLVARLVLGPDSWAPTLIQAPPPPSSAPDGTEPASPLLRALLRRPGPAALLPVLADGRPYLRTHLLPLLQQSPQVLREHLVQFAALACNENTALMHKIGGAPLVVFYRQQLATSGKAAPNPSPTRSPQDNP